MIVATALAASLLGAAAPGASAATTFGSECEGNVGYPGKNTMLESLGAAKGVPVSGVITAWKLNGGSSFGALTQRLKVARGLPGSEPVIVGESAPALISVADAGVATRVPVQAGDLIGLSSQSAEKEVVFCSAGASADELYVAEGDVAVGEKAAAMGYAGEAALPVRVTIEPDADGDGFGDETQDACPTSALVQTACPTLALPTASGNQTTPPPPTPLPPTPHPLAVAAAHKGSVTVKVTSALAATVAVKGQVGLGGGAKVTPSGGSKALAAGRAASFTLKFPKALKEKLATLAAKSKLKLKVTITATSPAGPVGTAALTVLLHGQG